MAPTSLPSNQQQFLVQSGSLSSEAIAITFGTITVLVTVIGVAITWRQHLRSQNLPPPSNIDLSVEMLPVSGNSATTPADEGDTSSADVGSLVGLSEVGTAAQA